MNYLAPSAKWAEWDKALRLNSSKMKLVFVNKKSATLALVSYSEWDGTLPERIGSQSEDPPRLVPIA